MQTVYAQRFHNCPLAFLPGKSPSTILTANYFVEEFQ